MDSNIILSRTDKIGDMILTLPMAGVLKEAYPDVQITMLTSKYAAEVAKRSKYVDHVVVLDDLDHAADLPQGDYFIHVFPTRQVANWAKSKGYQHRIGTKNRLYHWWTCNEKVALSRKNSPYHEAVLNLRLLEPLGIKSTPNIDDLWEYIGWENPTPTIDHERFQLIFHPKSMGSAKEWPLERFIQLANKLADQPVDIIVTGTQKEGDIIRQEAPELLSLPNVTDRTGCYTLPEFIDTIGAADGLLAGSTGPLHIAAASGIKSLGLYPAQRPMHAGRWHPIGQQVAWISEDQISTEKALNIPVEKVFQQLSSWWS